MLFLVIEKFRDQNAKPVYARLREKGRQMPEGLRYVNSWVTADLSSCYQVVECDDQTLMQDWIKEWSDLIDFEVLPVIESRMAEKIALDQH